MLLLPTKRPDSDVIEPYITYIYPHHKQLSPIPTRNNIYYHFNNTKIAASVVLKLFISGNKRYHTTYIHDP